MRNTFRGAGLRLRDHRELARDQPIENAPVPPLATIAMRQDGGPPAVCVVEVGDVVAEGTLVGRAQARGSGNVHTSVPGRVAAIVQIDTPDGGRTEAVVVELEGRFARSGKPHQVRDWQRMSPDRIGAALRDQGVVGLGGETFPLRHLWAGQGAKKPETLVVNGVESEPFLTGGHRLLVERTTRIVSGVRIAERLLDPARVVIALDAGEPELVVQVEAEVRRLALKYQVVSLEALYPKGQPRYLLEAITGRDLTHPGEPEDVGCVVIGVDTLHAVYEAVVFDQPLVERVVTVSGSVARPSNLKARIGTPVSELIEECGGPTEPGCRVVLGGPMTGLAIADLSLPLTKGVNGVVVLSSRQARNPRRTSCISCGECIRVCPAGLSPVVLLKQISHGRLAEARVDGLDQCTECGCCSFACPAGIDLAQTFRASKTRARPA